MIDPRYLVKDTDQFDPAQYPGIVEDVDVILASMEKTAAAQNTEMLVSFVKAHSLSPDLVKTNPALAERISSSSLSNLEALFASAAKNPSFCRQLEDYILRRFSASDVSSLY